MIVSDFTFEHLPDPEQVAAEFFANEARRLDARPNGQQVGIRGHGVPTRPHALHARLLGRIQPQGSEADVFPTVYRLNTPAAAVISEGEVIWYHDNGDPSYHFGNGLLYRLLLLGHRLLPGAIGNQHLFLFESSRA